MERPDSGQQFCNTLKLLNVHLGFMYYSDFFKSIAFLELTMNAYVNRKGRVVTVVSI